MDDDFEDFEVTFNHAIRINDIILGDIVAMKDWSMIKYSLLDRPSDILNIEKLIRGCEFGNAILQTLLAWAGVRGDDATFKQLVSTLRRHRLMRVSYELVAKREWICNRAELPALTQSQQPATPEDDGVSQDNIHYPATRDSEVDSSRKISKDLWVVSLARKPDSRNPQHAFIIMEGILNNQARIYFIELISKDGLGVGLHKGKLRKFEAFRTMANYLGLRHEDRLIYARENYQLMRINSMEKTIAASWIVLAENAIKLLQHVDELIACGEEGAPRFHLAGRDSVAARFSGASSSHEAGHNCFTWAKELLSKLDEPSIINSLDKGSDLRYKIICATSYFLVDERPARSEKWFLLLTILTGVLAIVIAFF